MTVSGDVSIITGKTKTFGVWDYVLFVAILVISAGIGFYHAWKDRRKQTVKDFLLAGGNMQVSSHRHLQVFIF
jgi:sodium-coupled monocarboxylate transporter 8/12